MNIKLPSSTKAFVKRKGYVRYFQNYQTMALVWKRAEIPLCGLLVSDVLEHEHELWEQLKAQFYGMDTGE